MPTAFTADYRRLRAKLRKARRDVKITQQDLARRLRKPQSFVSKYENGERRLDVIETLQILAALGVPLETFLAEFYPKSGYS